MQLAPQKFLELLKSLLAAYPTLSAPPQATLAAWLDIVGDLDEQQVKRAIGIIRREMDTIYPSTNIGALIRKNAEPTITEATISEHLMRANRALRQTDGDPFGYLRRIDPALLEMAENAGLLDTGLSADAASFRSRDVAKQYIERRANAKRGYTAPSATVPVERQLAAPRTTQQLSDDQQRVARENLAKIRAIIANGGKTPAGETESTGGPSARQQSVSIPDDCEAF
jgi:hypothetical protein